MFALLHSSFLLFAGDSGVMRFYDEYLNIPGFEAWKFFNLAVFIAAMVYVLKKPLSEAFKARREEIRAELIKAEAERQAALAKLTAAEAKLAQLENEKANILQKAKDEAEAEKKRLAEQTAIDIERLRQQSQAEIARLINQLRAELKRFSADESIRRAEEKLRTQIDGEKDVQLIRASIQEIGGLN